MSVSLTSKKKKKKEEEEEREEKGLGIEIHKLIENLIEDIIKTQLQGSVLCPDQ